MPKGCIKLSKNAFILTISCVLGSFASSFAQGLVNNGAKIVITNNSNIYINGTTGNFKNQAGGTITNSTAGGTIIVGGNWDNQAANFVFTNDGSTVVFNSASAQSITGTNPTAFYNITANKKGTKTFTAVNSTLSRLLSVGDSTTVNGNGNMTILATATSNGSVGPLLNTAKVTNNVIVQSYFTAGLDNTYRNFRGVSSPINDNAVVGNKTYKQLQSKFIITGTLGTTNGFDQGSVVAPYGTTIKTYNEAAALGTNQFTNLTNINQVANPGTGFFFYYRGNRTSNYTAGTTYATGSKVVAPYATPEAVTMEYTGPINQGNVSVPLSFTDNQDGDAYKGMNLVGNPYPSAIDWEKLKVANSGLQLGAAIYVIRPQGQFAVYQNPTVDSIDATRYIMPGQAFYVQSGKSGQTFIFTENCKVPYPSSPVMRFLSLPGKDSPLTSDFAQPMIGVAHASASPSKKSLRLKLTNDARTDETLIVFSDGADPEFDMQEDALYFAGNAVTLYSKSKDGKNLSINVTPPPVSSSAIDLNVSASSSGNLKIIFSDLSALGSTQMFLQDNYLNKIEPVNNGFSYPFEIDAKVQDSFGSGRFKLIFKPQTIVASLDAEKVFGGSEVKWNNDNKLENKTFIVERSADGKTFQSIATLTRIDGKANYSVIDNSPANGINYYRLKLVESDGLFSYSNTTVLYYRLAETDDEPSFIAYPNPVKDVLNIVLKKVSKTAIVSVFNLSGQKLKTQNFADLSQASINVADLVSGVYIVKVQGDSGKELGTEKFIKE